MAGRRTPRILVGCGLFLVLGVCAVEAQAPATKKNLTLERLYQYPRLEGTAPVGAKWSRDSRKLAFLWNDKGYSFRDLWVYDVATQKLTRLTELEQPRDLWTELEAEKDPKLKKYLPPETGLSGFEWAPDSTRLAFAFRGELYLVAADPTQGGVTRLTKTKEGEAEPKFSPDSTRLLFTRASNLWVLELTTGQLTQLTTDGTGELLNTGSPAWSPDGKWVSFVQINRKSVPQRSIPNYAGREVSMRKQYRTFAKDETPPVRLGVVSAAGGEVRWLTETKKEYYRDIQWSPVAAHRLAVLRREENLKQQHIDVVDFGQAEVSIKTIYSEEDPAWLCSLCNFVEWSPDGRKLLFSSERDGWNHLYLLSVAEGSSPSSPVQLTRGAWEVETGYRSPAELRPRFSKDGKKIFFTSTAVDASERHLFVLPVAGGEPQRLTTRKGYNAAVVSPDESCIALLYSSWEKPWDLYLLRAQPDAEPAQITQSPLPEFFEYFWPQPKLVEFPARDGRRVRALLFPPTTLAVDVMMEATRPAARGRVPRPKVQLVPGVVFVHGAGYAQAVLNRWGGYSTERFQFNQFLAQQGYAVLDIDYRSSSGYGRDWRTDVYLHLGGKDLEDELAGVDYLKTLGYVDTSRLGIWGASYGGFMTLMAMFKAPDVFQAGVAWAAVTDWENYARDYTQERLRSPEEQPEAYQRSSPIHHVAGLKNHLLLIHGMVDDNVHFQDAVQLMDALVAAGKNFDTVTYPQESHSWSRPTTWLHSFRKTFDFFEQHLKPK